MKSKGGAIRDYLRRRNADATPKRDFAIDSKIRPTSLRKVA